LDLRHFGLICPFGTDCSLRAAVTALVAKSYLPEETNSDPKAIKAAIEGVISDIAYELWQPCAICRAATHGFFSNGHDGQRKRVPPHDHSDNNKSNQRPYDWAKNHQHDFTMKLVDQI
jgi:hypothetical protein